MPFSHTLKNITQLIARWLEEPIGIAVPVIAFVAVWLPPQMPDMFAGMDAPLWSDQLSTRPIFFAFAAMILGLSSWFWTRAALTAHRKHGELDKVRIKHRRASHGQLPHAREGEVLSPTREQLNAFEWSHEWAPRIAMLASCGITLLPIVFSIAGGRIQWGMMGSWLLSFGLVGLLYLFILFRTRIHWMNAFGAPEWMSRYRATRILACAPFGWPFAILSLACSMAALLCVVAMPSWVEDLDAPTTAIASLAFIVGPLVITLALFRSLTELGLKLLRYVVNRGDTESYAPGEEQRLKLFANYLGMLVMLSWLLSPPWVVNKHVVPLAMTRVIEPANNGPCPPISTLPNGEPIYCRPDLERAVRAWAETKRAQSGRIDQRLPLIIVAAEGGASRAAVWLLSTMRMLDHDTQGAFGQHVFAISGVSGGSLGAVTYVRMVRAGGRTDGSLDWTQPGSQGALKMLATDDLLSSTIATYFLADLFGSLVGPLWTVSGVPDRNAALETAFDRLWDQTKGFEISGTTDRGFLGVRQSQDPAETAPLLPHLMLNGTDVTSGRRIITSSIRLSSAQEFFPDSGDFLRLASRDIQLSTAVTNSARFPFVSPAGRFISPTENRDYQIVDGGYFENYGARTAWELARAIDALNRADATLNVVPIIVIASNDLDADQPPRGKGGRCRTQLADYTADGNQVTIRCDEPRVEEPCIELAMGSSTSVFSAHDQSIVPQSLAPILGLAATRTAHGRDALNIVKRDFCQSQTGQPGDPSVRMIHIAMAKPDRAKGEAAPMNWVLGPDACHFMLNIAPWVKFNRAQAFKLNTTLHAIMGTDQPAPPTRAAPTIACRAR